MPSTFIFGNKGKQFAQDEQGRLMTRTGNTEVIKIYDALAITDTSNHISSSFNLSIYKSILLVAKNTHDQDIRLSPYLLHGGSGIAGTLRMYQEDGTWKTYDPSDTSRYAVLPKNMTGTVHVLNSYFSELEGLQWGTAVRWVAKADEIPTTGSLTLHVIGGM